MKRFYFLNLLIVSTILIGCATKVSAQLTTFNYSGSMATYTVGNGVTAIGVDVQGACGGKEYGGSYGVGGAGGRVQANLAVSAGQVLYMYVGGIGGNGPTGSLTTVAGGYNGGGSNGGSYYGGSGGGASDIRLTNSTVSTYTTTNRAIVAGGGGGAGE